EDVLRLQEALAADIAGGLRLTLGRDGAARLSVSGTKDPEAWQLYLEGLRFMRNQEYQKAIDAWEKVLERYPGNEATLDNIEQARLRLKSNNQD
ncbi:MAG TPA: hypothetical protein PK112_08635, partial [candidate division Zixibacteria bacterium]|nr:hypothetical protein [candidate division Zixibacteria bacterium]